MHQVAQTWQSYYNYFLTYLLTLPLWIYYTTEILFNSNLATTCLKEVVISLKMESFAIDRLCKTHIFHALLLLLSRFSPFWLCATPERSAHQAPLSPRFSRQEHWSGFPFPSPMHESEKWKWSCSVVSNS